MWISCLGPIASQADFECNRDRGEFMIRSVYLSSVAATFAFTSIVFICTSISSTADAAVKPVTIDESATLKEKLTGQRDLSKSKPTPKNKTVVKKLSPAQMAKLRPSERGLILAREAKDSGDYVLSIKRYNFIAKHFSKTPEAKLALMDKAEIYQKMGLAEQAQYNIRKAQSYTVGTRNVAAQTKKLPVQTKKVATKRGNRTAIK